VLGYHAGSWNILFGLDGATSRTYYEHTLYYTRNTNQWLPLSLSLDVTMRRWLLLRVDTRPVEEFATTVLLYYWYVCSSFYRCILCWSFITDSNVYIHGYMFTIDHCRTLHTYITSSQELTYIYIPWLVSFLLVRRHTLVLCLILFTGFHTYRLLLVISSAFDKSSRLGEGKLPHIKVTHMSRILCR